MKRSLPIGWLTASYDTKDMGWLVIQSRILSFRGFMGSESGNQPLNLWNSLLDYSPLDTDREIDGKRCKNISRNRNTAELNCKSTAKDTRCCIKRQHSLSWLLSLNYFCLDMIMISYDDYG
jgi:hypothetical protein